MDFLYNIPEEWKHKDIPHKQLELNKYELNNRYPPHWISFLNLIDIVKKMEGDSFNSYNLLDLGCGVGTTYQLLKDNNINCGFIGYDFSEHMIDLAKKEWNYDKFYVKDVTKDIDNITYNDIIYTTGLLCMLPNSNEILDKLLKYNTKYVMLNRLYLDNSSHISLYKAYDMINCIRYTFSKDEFYNIIKENGYNIISNIDNNAFLLVKSNCV